IDPALGIDIGQATGGAGSVLVSGGQSLLTNSGRFLVGDASTGTLSIRSGGTVMATPGTVAGLAGMVIANSTGAAGSWVDVTGAGSQLVISGLLNVGAAGSGAMQITAGATVTA